MTIHQHISNIIFDLGGVLLNINPERTLNKLMEFCDINREELLKKLADSHLYSEFDTGKKSPDQFRNEIRMIAGVNLPDKIVDDIWNELLLDFPLNRVVMLQKLSTRFRVFLLSNTNVIHFERYTASFLDIYHFHMETLFEKMYLTFEIGLRKPDPEVFRYVLENSHLMAKQTLFVDDSEENIAAASLLGFSTCHIAAGNDVTDAIKACIPEPF